MDELTLEMTRVLSASPQAVFAAVTDPAELVNWFGPEGFTMPAADFQPRVGARYRLRMQPPEGEAFFIAGVVHEVDAPSRLVYTFAYENPDPDDIENVVSLSLVDLGGSTELSLVQGPFKTEGRRALHHDGWTDSFDKLERLVAGR
jgi:uncharacterized protein YndB with AHSA1/START domain